MHQQEPSWRSINWCNIIKIILHMNQHSRCIDTNLTCCLWHVLSKREKIIVISFWHFVIPRGRKFFHGGRILQWRRSFWCKIKEGETFCQRDFCFQISLCYDMLYCHQCQRGRLLKTIIQLYVIFDVTKNVKPLPSSQW